MKHKCNTVRVDPAKPQRAEWMRCGAIEIVDGIVSLQSVEELDGRRVPTLVESGEAKVDPEAFHELAEIGRHLDALERLFAVASSEAPPDRRANLALAASIQRRFARLVLSIPTEYLARAAGRAMPDQEVGSVVPQKLLSDFLKIAKREGAERAEGVRAFCERYGFLSPHGDSVGTMDEVSSLSLGWMPLRRGARRYARCGERLQEWWDELDRMLRLDRLTTVLGCTSYERLLGRMNRLPEDFFECAFEPNLWPLRRTRAEGGYRYRQVAGGLRESDLGPKELAGIVAARVAAATWEGLADCLDLVPDSAGSLALVPKSLRACLYLGLLGRLQSSSLLEPMRRTCEWCGEPISGRADKSTCGAACRMRLGRERRAAIRRDQTEGI